MIYLDYAAHAPADPAVLERFCDMERRFPANPNSVHAAGKAARGEMARVTEQIAALTGASPAEVIFTSGATEANNLAIKGIAQASRHIGKHIISTPPSIPGQRSLTSLAGAAGRSTCFHRTGRHG
ncbi:MAG: aminotransferase class V-fold PLP-dependent enzyme [Butyricicoccus sp.]